jgi:hypothetical protein
MTEQEVTRANIQPVSNMLYSRLVPVSGSNNKDILFSIHSIHFSQYLIDDTISSTT